MPLLSTLGSVITALDSSGDTSSGALLNVYAAGTSTPSSLFSDEGLNTAIANPVVFDSAGRPQTEVYLAAGLYKLDLTTSGGSSLAGYPIDNVLIHAKNNFTATSDPTATDDVDGGWSVGSVWINTSTGGVFRCTDNSDGAAVWATLLATDANGNVSGVGSVYLTEKSAADADVAGRLQVWAKDDTPNAAKFTDDAGNDYTFAALEKAQSFTAKQTMSGAPIEFAEGAAVASAATIDLDAATGNMVHITGTTTITTVTLAQGAWRLVVFDGALTFTHGASLILPTSANITTVAGDTALLVGEGSSVTRCFGYWRADGTAVGSGSTGWTIETAQATTSGTAKNFTGIPSGVTEIEVQFDGVSGDNAATDFLVQIGDSGGLETSGYVGSSQEGTSNTTNATTGFVVRGSSASQAFTGFMRLVKFTGNKWLAMQVHSNTAYGNFGSGIKTLSAELDRLSIVTDSNNFDAGEVNIRYK